MIRQLIKIMWHRKGRNFLLLMEIFFSFLVLFATLTLIIEQVRNYYTPLGFDYSDIYVLDIDRHGEEKSSAIEKTQQIKNYLRSMPEIANFSLSNSNVPFSFSTSNNVVGTNERETLANYYTVEPEYFETMDLELVAGRWLERGDSGKKPPVVINETLAQEIFKDQNPIGQTFTNSKGESTNTIVGVVKQFRQDGEFSEPKPSMFIPYNLADTSAFYVPSTILLEVKAGAEAGWQQRLLDQSTAIGGSWSFEETAMQDMRTTKAKFTLIPLIALSIVCGFLIFNVALGLYGVLWYNISKRYSEIGIRRAIGATRTSIRLQMIGEVLVLATFGVLLGVILAVQFPLLGVFNVETPIYALSIATSLFLIYLLVALCAWYPSRQASAIEPANALHYE